MRANVQLFPPTADSLNSLSRFCLIRRFFQFYFQHQTFFRSLFCLFISSFSFIQIYFSSFSSKLTLTIGVNCSAPAVTHSINQSKNILLINYVTKCIFIRVFPPLCSQNASKTLFSLLFCCFYDTFKRFLFDFFISVVHHTQYNYVTYLATSLWETQNIK